jgi:integrase/recombinase XerD
LTGQPREKDSERLFLARKAVSLSGVIASVTRQIRKQNGKIKTLQDLRVSVICNWLKKHHIRQVQYMAGHRWVGSTYRYQSQQLESLAEQLEKVHPLK